MGTSTNSKVFVSPGVYTSEVDLSFVAQSVGVTTLGLVGETLKGPAFEPIFIRNFDEFSTYFGGTSPEKYVNTQIPKYEASYIAKSYLQQSNQLFVTRVLGLSGYDAGPSWSIVIKGNVDPSTIDFKCISATTIDCESVCTEIETFDFEIPFTGCTNDINTIIFDSASIPSLIANKFNDQYEEFNGSTSSLSYQMRSQILEVLNNPSLEDDSIYYYGAIPGAAHDILNSAFTASTNVFGVDNVNASKINYSSSKNDSWYYSLFNHIGNKSYTGYSFNSVLDELMLLQTTTTTTSVPPTTTTTTTANPCSPTPTPTLTPTPTPTVPVNCYTGKLKGTIYVYSGMAYTNYDDVVVATLRSRGLNAEGSGPSFEVTGLTSVSLNTTGQYSNVKKNPFGKFGINVTNVNGQTLFFETSFSTGDSEYLTKVFGTGNFDKDRNSFPLFVEEIYPTLLSYGYSQGFIRGLGISLIALPGVRDTNNSSSIGWYLEQYQTPSSPWVVSELRGNKVTRLFKFTTISDGDDANTEVKISIANISFNNNTFDVLVRDFFDTDSNPVVIEKFTNCSMDPNENSYIAKKIGTTDGEYQLNSKYIMIDINENAPTDSLPCGFEGYVTRQYDGVNSPFPLFKTKYNFPGEVISNPPFGFTNGKDNTTVSNGDNVRRTYLGFSDLVGIDYQLLSYKGKQMPLNLGCDTTGEEWAVKSKGFHMDMNATGITISNGFSTSGQSAFYVGSAEFTSDPQVESNPYYRLYARKFTLLVSGGFDGWDIYREHRTNADKFKLGRSGYLKGADATCSPKYPTATGWGAFKQIAVGDNTQDWANSDYYAYLLGYKTFANPEAVNINVFASPGIDYVNNSDLVESVIDIIENDRADSIYITTTPDYNMFTPSVGNQFDLIYPQEAVDNLETTGIDSNYTATYYPWVLTRDSANNTQIYLPPTAEVTKNLALTDNIAFPWFAAAGYTRGLVNSIKARKKLTQEDRDVLYKGRINPIATFSDVGTVIWGNKTLQIRESALDRINVRRLLLQARKLISAVSVRLLFEQNDDRVRQDFLSAVNPILDGIRRDRGLYDFRVEVSSDTADLDRNQMTGKIYIKPTKSLEYIDITFYITPTGASFENI